MNTLRNKVQLIGNLGNDPEIITLDSGKKLAKFSLEKNKPKQNGIIWWPGIRRLNSLKAMSQKDKRLLLKANSHLGAMRTRKGLKNTLLRWSFTNYFC